MPGKSGQPGQFWRELRRRKVLRRTMVYGASGFVLLELVSIIAEPFGLPDWSLKFVFISLCIGFVISIILSWFYDFTPGGLERIKPSHVGLDAPVEKPSRLLAWKITSYISIVIIIGLLVFNIVRGRKQSEVLSELVKSIAVLPFDNLSTDEDNSHIGDAITDEVIAELRKIKEFRVLSRSTTMQYKDNRPAIPEIAEDLGVNYIIEGSIQLYKEDVSIRVQVMRAIDEDQIWGYEYNDKWKDIFSIQDDIAIKVAQELRIALSPMEIQQIEKKPTDNLEAYNLYLKGKYYWQMQTREGLKKALEYFEQALQKDPNYALAYIGIASVYLQSTFHGSISPNEAYPKIKVYVKKALDLNNSLAEAYVVRGNINRLYDWNWKAAEQNYKRALQLNPNLAEAHMFYAFSLAFTEQSEESILEAKRAQELDPLSSWINAHVGMLYVHDGEHDKAIEELKMTKVMDPDYWNTYNYLGDAYAGKFMLEEAIEEYEKAADLSGENPVVLAVLANTYYNYGQNTKGDKLFDSLKQRSKNEYIPPMCFCLIHQARGEMDLYYKWLEKACKEHDGFLPWYRVYPVELFRVPDEPRFNELLENAGLFRYQ